MYIKLHYNVIKRRVKLNTTSKSVATILYYIIHQKKQLEGSYIATYSIFLIKHLLINNS